MDKSLVIVIVCPQAVDADGVIIVQTASAQFPAILAADRQMLIWGNRG